MYTYDQSERQKKVMSYLDYIWDAIFSIEMFIKLVGFGFKIYAKDRWNILDGTIVIVSLLGYILKLF